MRDGEAAQRAKVGRQTQHGVSAAQYHQDYQVNRVPNGLGGTDTTFFWSPTGGATVLTDQVIDISPEVVYLAYNCHYMTSICDNAHIFMQSDRGLHLHGDGHAELDTPYQGAPTFGYDFNTGKLGSRRSDRGDHSCPGTWKNNHVCPETNQKPVWREIGEWMYTEIEPSGQDHEFNVLRHLRAVNQIAQRSKIRYSCDEFPPATWVEGGDGLSGSTPANTRCAGFRCTGYKGENVKAEQNWQGWVHGRLQKELKAIIKERYTGGEFQWYKEKNSVAFFKFLTYNRADGIAAQVMTFEDKEATTLKHPIINENQQKRSDGGNASEPVPAWRSGALYEQLLALAEAGHGRRHVAHANETKASASVGQQTWADMGLQARWQLGGLQNLVPDEENDGDDSFPRAREPKPEPEPEPAPVNHAAAAPARAIVKNAIVESARRNEARYKNPLRNQYRLKPGTVIEGETAAERRRRQAGEEAAPPLLYITDEIAAAAALVAEADAVTTFGNTTRRQAPSGSFWMGSIARKGVVPWGDDSTYAVFRNVLDYGATGNGITDDTAAIKKAMTDGTRCGEKCNGSTTKNAIVYFPPGTYLISTTIPLPFGTQVIGDAINRPLLKAAPGFVGLGVLSTNEYTGNGTGIDGLDQQYYVNTANFYRQLRNIRIDVRDTDPLEKIACLHYQIAQATSMQNVELIAGPAQTGIFAENGSGGQISDITFTGGGYGIYGGNQQFTAQRLRFSGCTIGVQIIWDWGWVWKSVVMTNVGTGFRLLPNDGDSGNIGSISVLDSSFTTVGTVVVIAPPSSTPDGGRQQRRHILAGGTTKIDHWALGPVYAGSATARTFSNGAKIGNYRRPATLINDNGAYYERDKPQYENVPLSSFLHVRDFGATGDGATDDTAAFQTALNAAQGSKILFVDAGSYILTSTITVPAGSRIVGEAWSQLVAWGPYFQDANNPKVLIQVGKPGQVGGVEMQDLIITTKGPTAGAVLIEWNVRAESKGAAALWDVHVRIGGATGTDLGPDECPALLSGIAPGCNAASLMMHITPSASGYFENMWLWVADHMIDDPDLIDANNTMVQNSVYVARGLLVESTSAVWLYGTSSEHAVMYQYNFHKAKNIFAAHAAAACPVHIGRRRLPGDPDYTCAAGNEFSGCDESWAVLIRQSESIFVAGAGLYSWFSTYTQTCIAPRECQKVLALLDNNGPSVRIQHLVTIGAKYMAVMNGQAIAAVANANVDSHPYWSQISVIDVTSSGAQFDTLIWIDPTIWHMPQPEFTCVPPCYVQLPPWPGATSTVNYPLLTFEVVTLTEAPGVKRKKRQGFEDFWPKPATTTRWPYVVYTGPNGTPTTLSPTIAFPTPPAVIGGHGVVPPPKGAWPTSAVRPQMGLADSPTVEPCAYGVEKCQTDPLLYDDDRHSTPIDDDDDADENWAEDQTLCPASTTPVNPLPAPKPSVLADPMTNKVECYNSGQKAKHWELDSIIGTFCNEIARYAGWQNYRESTDGWQLSKTLYSDPLRSAPIDVNFIINKGCTMDIEGDDCSRYLHVAVDSCDCGGVDGKHGGVVRNNCFYWRVDPNVRWL
ncbi:glycoside hydrolase family 55 protein [Parathielavia hyrcaniae]|uniref:Glycoside hydrolase family 55 protein n=1 Tax=Parathielavia hyrcaniae TaxID=113614 RepID=A0AAN6Q359_9PEZI|nr:glycoside hydrolase family 55 protein [Parathielavia hyrcaniae]